MDQDEFNHLLAAILEPDTARVKEATAKLKKDYYTNPKCLGLLFQLLISEESFQLRQLAATQARNLIPKHWPEVPDAHKSGIRTHLLQTTLNERDPRVRHASARVIGAIVQTDLAEGEWQNLPDQMIQAAISPKVQEREVSTYLLYVIIDDTPEEQNSNFAQFFEIFQKTIRDPESGEVRMNTLLALSKMAHAIDPDNDEESLENFHQAIPGMVEVLKQTIESKDDHRMTQCFEAFQELFEPDAKIIGKYFGDLVQLMAGIAANNNMVKEARTQALNFILSAVLYRKLRFQGLRIGDRIVGLIVDVLVHADEVDDTDEFSLTLSAISLLNLMASQLPPSQVVIPALDLFKKFCESSNPRERQAATSALSSCFEGAPEFFDTQLQDITPRLLTLLHDSDIKVRESAVRGTKDLAETLPEALSKDHRSFMAALAKNLTSAVQNIEGSEEKANSSIAVHCCCAIDAMVHGLSPEDVATYLPELVPHLSRLFSHPDAKIKSSAIGAVGSIAESSKEAFVPYFEQTMKTLHENLGLKESEEDVDLRSITIDSMGGMAEAVGPEAFKPYVQPLMQATEENLRLDNSRLKETSYMFWSAMARVYKENFEPFLEGATQSILEALEQDDGPGVEVEAGAQSEDLIGQEVFIAGNKVKVVKGDGGEGAEDGDDDEWDDLDALSPISEEKEVALEALAEIFSHVGTAFLPYYEKSIEMIMSLIEHHYEATRRAAISAMYRAYASLFQLQPVEKQKWEPGLPVRLQPTTEVAKFGDVVMTATRAQYMTEEDSAIIVEINRNLGDTLKLTGPSLISGTAVLESVAQVLLSIITKQHACQADTDESELSDDEGSEDDFYVIESALDAIAALAAVLGPQFGELWKIFAKPFAAHASASAPSQRSAAVGSLADVIRGTKGGITPYASPLLKLLLHRLGDEDSQVKSNAAFAVGLLAQYAGSDDDDSDEVARAFPTILGKLEPLLRDGAEPRQLDNAAGCVARLIARRPHVVPLPEVLPPLVRLLPLRVDFEENAPVWGMLVELFRAGDATALGLVGQVVPALEKVLGTPAEQLEDDTREALRQLVRFLHRRETALVEAQPGLMEIVRHG